MKHIFQRIRNNKSGEVMLESAIVMTLSIFIFLAMLGFGFLLYQNAMLANIANTVASDVAATYKYPQQEIGSSTLSTSAISGLKKYRMTFSLNKMEALNKERITDYVDNAIHKATVGIVSGGTEVTRIDAINDNIGRVHIEVEIRSEGKFPFSDILSSLHIIDDPFYLTATGRADCVDITGYAGYINFVNYASTKLSGGGVLGVVGSAADIIVNVRQTYEYLTN